MEVPFLSSSAISRAHYNLVQKVEAAPLQYVDDILCQEVEVLQRRLEQHHPTPPECMELLVLLLYCATATLGRVTYAMLEFAVPHAVTLAEVGDTINQKRIGYLFCNEIMNPSDELQVMLVNTLRKDLEDPAIARICLALDSLLMNCPSDAVPAVTPRLIELLAHDSSHVKRKTMAVIRRIGPHDPETLRLSKDKVRLRLRDADLNVASAALCLLRALIQARVIRPEDALELALEECALGSSASNREYKQGLQLKLAEFVGGLGHELHVKDDSRSLITSRVIETLHGMLRHAKDSDIALILEVFRALSNCPTEALSLYFSSRGAAAKLILSRLVGSTKPNIQYLCLVCLLALDPIFWAGTTDLIPPAFEERQVHVIMGFLESPDRVIRMMTSRVLYRVDPQILSMQLSQLQSTFRSSSRNERVRIAELILEVAAALDTDGEVYASRVKEIAIGLEDGRRHNVKGKGNTSGSGTDLVFENLVEQVLLHLRTRPFEFCRAFVDSTTRIPVSDAGPTLTLIVAAVICEYGALSSISQEDLLRSLAGRLNTNPPAIQEALLLAMLRVTARCDNVFPDVTDEVRKLHGISRSHIRHRCDQYLLFSGDVESLKSIAIIAKSDTLPDFIYALEMAQTPPETRQQGNKTSDIVSRSQVAAGKLRYEAYEPPRPAPKLTRRRSSQTSVNSHATSPRSGRSDSISSSHSHSRSRYEHASNISGDPDDDVLSRTLTAGDLALAVHEPKFTTSSSTLKAGSQADDRPRSAEQSPLIDMMKTDLITLDSPFLADPNEVPEQHVSYDFHGTWDALKDSVTSRGWCEVSPEQVKQRVHALPNYRIVATPSDLQTGKGEFLLVTSRIGAEQQTNPQAVLRLVSGEEDSTLWQLRCSDSTIRAELRRLLNDT